MKLPIVAIAAACIASGSVFGEEAIGMASIEALGLQAAREAAIRDALMSATIAGQLSIRTKSGAVNQEFRDAMVVDSETSVSNVQVVSQQSEGGFIKVRISFERQPKRAERQACATAGIGLRNVALTWLKPRRAYDGVVITETRRLAVERIEQALGSGLPGYLATDADAAIYSLRLDWEAESAAGLNGLRYEILGPNGERVQAGRIPLGSVAVAEKTKRHLGYATLRYWELTEAGAQSMAAASASLQTIVRCLPPVAQVRFDKHGAASLVVNDAHAPALANALAFVSWNSPFGDDGVIDLLKFDGIADISSAPGTVTVTLSNPQAQAAQPRTGYVVLQ